MAFAFAGCSGGSPSDTRVATACIGQAVNTICLDGCNLGCRGTTCEITDIAQNQTIVLRFSQSIDRNWANEDTIQFRTATGEQPVGHFLVNGTIVEFVPEVLAIGSQSFFGFRAGETYTMTLPGGLGEANAVRSTSGQPLKETISCQMTVTRGIIDLNGVPPSAVLVTPTDLAAAPIDSVITLGFNEMIDGTPFQQGSSANAPVAFDVARMIDGPGGSRICSPQFSPLAGTIAIDQLPELPNGIGAQVRFTPLLPLPGDACVRVSVTDQVHDLAGAPAAPQTFLFRTAVTARVEDFVLEEFDTDDRLDAQVSGGVWANGSARFAKIGGDGRMGTFDNALLTEPGFATSLGTVGGVRSFRINTNNAVIPASRTFSRTAITVTDGRFEFSDMIIPTGVKIVFSGSAPPVFTVRGRIQMDGILDVSGAGTVWVDGTGVPQTPLLPGQAGGVGGIGAGNGGAGGQQGSGLGPDNIGGVPTGAENGRRGQDCKLPAGHAYAASQVAGTGGSGSNMFPAHGRSALLNYPVLMSSQIQAMESAAGGGGGGYVSAGLSGRCEINTRIDPNTLTQPRLDLMGPANPGGAAVPLTPITSSSHWLHFLIGGSGGGGGASHPALLLQNLAQPTLPGAQTYHWGVGGGGGGGGGAIALRAGRALRMASGSQILAKGGSAGSSPTTSYFFANMCPGGGGSGGSIVLQSDDVFGINGDISVAGGLGGVLDRTNFSIPDEAGRRIRTVGGDGSSGMIRLERPGASTGDAPLAVPSLSASNIGELVDLDSRVAFQSFYYWTRQPFGPQFVRYEIRALVDNVPVVYSDDSSVGVPPLQGNPLQAFWQAATVDPQTLLPDPADADMPWRSLVGGGSGIDADGRNGFRFLFFLDRSSGVEVIVQSVKVIFRA